MFEGRYIMQVYASSLNQIKSNQNHIKSNQILFIAGIYTQGDKTSDGRCLT